MNIIINCPNIESNFLNGTIVFKVTEGLHLSDENTIGIVTTVEDYKRKLFSHQYSPILFLISFYQQLAYLYGCLNLEFEKTRNKTFSFWWRKLRTKQWNLWFSVGPYRDPLYISLECTDQSESESFESESFDLRPNSTSFSD